MTDDQKKKPTAGFWITIALIVAGVPAQFRAGVLDQQSDGIWHVGRQLDLSTPHASMVPWLCSYDR